MSVQNTGSLLDGPEPESRRGDGPELKRCTRCGRLGVRLFLTTPDGPVCAARAACTGRQRADH